MKSGQNRNFRTKCEFRKDYRYAVK